MDIILMRNLCITLMLKMYMMFYIYVSMCLEPPFPSLWWRTNQSIHFGIPLRLTTSAQVTRCMHRLSHQKWTWHHQSIIWWCTNDVELSYDDIYIIFMSGLRGTEGQTYGRKGSQFWDFKCRAHRTELIPSRVLQCVCTLGQLGILYLITTNMCLVYWLISLCVFLWSKLCFN